MDKNEFTENEKKIVEALEKGTALSLGELQRQSGMSRQAVINAVKRLKANGIVKRQWSQNGAYYFLAKMTYGAVSDW